MPKCIGVLALQGGFVEHHDAIVRLGHVAALVRTPEALASCDALIIPGGESTTIGHSHYVDVWQAVEQRVRDGMPCWGTCAGAILLVQRLLPKLGHHDVVGILRNAYGRQSASFVATLRVLPEICASETVPGVFIRAPQFTSMAKHAIQLAWLDSGACVAMQFQSLLLTTFHPELCDDLHFHRYFLRLCSTREKQH